MGLLDDAIREHLDLKRRSGADPGEIERAEREALGPVRRGPEESTDFGFNGEGDEQEVAAAPETSEDWHDPFADEDAAEPYESGREAPRAPRGDPLSDEALEDDPFADEEPAAQHEPGPPEQQRGVPEDDPFAATPDAPVPSPHPAEPPPSQSLEHLGQETAEYDVEGELEHSPEPAREDPLEETPEFLQDTPEHDRLWFEQRPPRDFDFED